MRQTRAEMGQPSRIRLIFARTVSLLLLPAGLVCVAVPFWMLTLPGRAEIIGDTRAAFGGGTDAGRLRAAYVDCTRQRSGSSSTSTRSIGITEYDCVIDLAEAPPPVAAAPARAGREPDINQSYDGFDGYEAQMAEFSRRTAEVNRRQAEQDRGNAAALDAFIAQSKARSGGSNRLERMLAGDRSGQLPAVRLLSAPGEPRRIGLVWGGGEIAWRWAQWLATSLLFFGFGGACLFAVWIAWKRR